MSKTSLLIGLVCLAGITAGSVLIIGPGVRLHHELHRSGILEPCGCRGSDEAGCEFVGKPEVWQSWSGHHRRERREGALLVGMSGVVASGYSGGRQVLSWAARKGEPCRQRREQLLAACALLVVLGIWAFVIFS